MTEPAGGGAFTIKDFCVAHSISEPFYFLLKAQGLAPREMHVKSKVLISYEAAEKWRRDRENHAAPELTPTADVDDTAPADGDKVD